MVTQERTFTAHEFWERAESFPDDKVYELIDGEIVEMPPASKLHAKIVTLIATFLNVFVLQNEAGTVLAEGGYTLDENNVRIPDVSFFKAERDVDLTDNTAVFAPDLAVEVISPGNTPRQVTAKTELYLNRGVTVVWNVYIDEQVVEVWRVNAAGKLEMESLHRDDTLTAEDVLPGFELPLADIFPQDEQA
jgi:Uma2 family endonuclease